MTCARKERGKGENRGNRALRARLSRFARIPLSRPSASTQAKYVVKSEIHISLSNAEPFCVEATAYISAPGDAELMRKMKETIDSQRDTIRSKNMEIDSLRNDLEAVCGSET